MKRNLKLSFSFLCLCLLALTACKKIDKFSQVKIPFSRSFTVLETPEEVIDIDVTSPKVSTQQNFLSQNFDIENERLESITLTSMMLIIDSLAQIDLSYLDFVELYILSDNQSEEKIAWSKNIPSDVGQELDLETTSLDLKAFMLEDSISLRLVGRTDELIDEEHELTIDSEFLMDLRILGQ